MNLVIFSVLSEQNESFLQLLHSELFFWDTGSGDGSDEWLIRMLSAQIVWKSKRIGDYIRKNRQKVKENPK